MTAVLPRTASTPETGRPSAADSHDPVDLYTWVLSVRDWRVHVLAEPRPGLVWGMQETRCGVWQPMACPVTVARRGEICPRCAAGGVALLELLPDRADVPEGDATHATPRSCTKSTVGCTLSTWRP